MSKERNIFVNYNQGRNNELYPKNYFKKNKKRKRQTRPRLDPN